MRGLVAVLIVAGCGDGKSSDGGPTTQPSTTLTGTGPATGTWDGSCAGTFTATYPVGGSGTGVVISDPQNYDLDPATLRLSDNGAVEGTFTFVRADQAAAETESYRVDGTRSGDELTLRLVGFATTSSSVPTTVTGVFPFALELTVGAELTGDLVVSDGPDERGRVPCAFQPR
jgi:hypothetical protein